MRGSDTRQGSLFSYVNLDNRIPAKHPIRKLRLVVDIILSSMDAEFSSRYADTGRPSIPPEQLLRALLLGGFASAVLLAAVAATALALQLARMQLHGSSDEALLRG